MTDLDRPLAAPPPPMPTAFGVRLTLAKKLALLVAVFSFLAIVVSRIDLTRDMHRLDSGMLGGSKSGVYNAIVADLADRAGHFGGHLRNVESAGSGENVQRLAAARNAKCDLAYALVQDGSDYSAPGAKKLELLGRLPKSESVFFLGRDGDKKNDLSSLAGAKIGVGPEGSGSARLAQQVFALEDLAGLHVVLSYHSIEEQLAMAERGELDLALVVIDEDAPLLVETLRSGRLQIAGLGHLDVVARRIPRLRTARIGAGQYDAIKVYPPEDKKVLRVDTLVITNGCESRSATIDLLTLLSDRFPDFIRHNKDTPNATGLELASASKGFFEHGGPESADEYAPWLVDLMPPANWAYIVMAVSILFNAMNAGHRFRLWRIDDARVRLESELSTLFGAGATLGDIQRTRIQGKLLDPSVRGRIEDLIKRFEALGGRSRRQSLSMLVPMGQEMAYRYQEGVIYQTLAVLRGFLTRWDSVSVGGPTSRGG
jgi:TRAP-type uncharacterized transport system substrate-binding protein